MLRQLYMVLLSDLTILDETMPRGRHACLKQLYKLLVQRATLMLNVQTLRMMTNFNTKLRRTSAHHKSIDSRLEYERYANHNVYIYTKSSFLLLIPIKVEVAHSLDTSHHHCGNFVRLESQGQMARILAPQKQDA